MISRPLITALALALAAQNSRAAVHELIVGTYGSPYLYTLEFDDTAVTLELVANTTVSVASSWIALSHDKKNIYGNDFSFEASSNQTQTYVSYSLTSATDINLEAAIPAGECTGESIFVIAASTPPYAVYGTPFGACGSVLSVSSDGAIESAIQNYSYSSSSGVHGLAFGKDNKFLYSADDSANSIWTHSVDSMTGELTFLSKISAPTTGANPRHLVAHPSGTYLYVIHEQANEIGLYSLDATTGVPTFANQTYPLAPSGTDNITLWADEVAMSYSRKFLWATTRARTAGATGYITALTLDDDGYIVQQNFLTATTTGGGFSNSVAPSNFSDEFVALTDTSTGFVQIWKLAEDGDSANVVAQVDLADGGCCGNAVWYS